MVRPPHGSKARIASRTVLLAVVLTITCSAARAEARAEENPKTNTDLIKYWSPMQDYLNQYGYLTSSPNGADNLRTEDKLRDAIKSMQRYGGVPTTGVVDPPTLALLERKRCGMPDLSPGERVRRYAIQGQSWPKKDLTWSVKQFPSGMHSGMVRMELSKAFKVWSEVSQLNFREVSSMNADIVVSFERGQHGDGYAFDGRGVVLAHAFFPGEGIGGDAHFDSEEPWIDGQPSPGIDGVRLFAVAAHEFGHSLGLSHSSVSGALMNPFYQTIKDNFQMPYDDSIAIQILYGAQNPVHKAPLSPYIPTTTRRPVATTTRRNPHPAGPTYGNPTRAPPPTRPTRAPTHRPSTKPSKCNTTFDAISVIRNQLFVFKGKYFWRFESQGTMRIDYPVEIQRLWNDDKLQQVDAVYERPLDTKIVFFSGAQYWLFNGVTKVPGYPKPLTDLGLPPDLKRIDAAMVWGYNGKTYLFSGTQYWRYDESEGHIELDYPQDMGIWRGVPFNIDAAFQNTDGHTYFFKGRKFWQFQDNFMRVKENKFNNINQYWFGCPSYSEQAPDVEDSDIEKSDKEFTTRSRSLSHTEQAPDVEDSDIEKSDKEFTTRSRSLSHTEQAPDVEDSDIEKSDKEFTTRSRSLSHTEQAPDVEDSDIEKSDKEFITASGNSHAVADLFLLMSFLTVFLLQRTMYISYL